MRERGPTKEFHIAGSTRTIRLRPFESGVLCNMDEPKPRIFPAPLSRWKCGNNLTEEQLNKLEEAYSEWSVGIVCTNCNLKGKICSGMQPFIVKLNIDNLLVDVKKFSAHLNVSLAENTHHKVDKIINQDTRCKPRFW